MKTCIRLLTLILFMIFSLNSAWAQKVSADECELVFFYGENLWNKDCKKEAALEFLRYVFLQDYQKGSNLAKAYEYLSDYYFLVKDYDKALNYILLKENESPVAAGQALDSDFIKEINIRAARAEKNKESLRMDLNLWTYRHTGDYSQKVQLAAWKALMINEAKNDDWTFFEEDYLTFINKYSQFFTTEEKEVIESSLEKIKSFKAKKPMLAAYLSFIPGLGQLYAGDVKDSLNAFALNGSLIGLSIYSICSGNVSDFMLLEFSPTVRFYRGNLYNAQKDSYEYNEKKRTELREPVLSILQAM